MSVVSGVTVPVVHVVDMAGVRHSDVSAALTVGVVMRGVLSVTRRLTFIGVVAVLNMQVVLMDIVDVVRVRHRDVAAAITVQVLVSCVLEMVGGSVHDGLLAVGRTGLMGVPDGISNDVRDMVIDQLVHPLPTVRGDLDQPG